MNFNKRDFLKLSIAGVAGVAVSSTSTASSTQDLKDITNFVGPITIDERKARIAKVQKNMRAAGISALVVEPGSSMVYFSGVRWWRSERLTCLVIPADGEIGVVTPYFEEPSVRESLTFGDDVRPWHEHESPYDLVANIIRDRGFAKGKVAFEDTVRFFVQHDIMKSLGSNYEMVSGRAIVLDCRMYKSTHEIALMHKANEVTLTAYAHTYSKLEVGMHKADISAIMTDAQTALGGSTKFAMALIGEASAYPHGSKKTKTLESGDVLLMDCGCEVHDYESDISRTFVIGEPSKKQRKVWDTVRRGQQIAFETAQIGTQAGAVDDAVRTYYESLGYGPGYKTPGLSHRTGHGIGMDGHESVNFVHGEETALQQGMCFSNEPGIYIYGEFGVRLEDCIYMTKDGPKWFTEPPASLDDPIGKVEKF